MVNVKKSEETNYCRIF